MAASRIKGITIEIGGDTTKLQTVLKGVNTEIKSTQSQMKDVEKLLKLDPGNTELLAQKHKLLGEAVAETKEKLETLKTAAEQANTALANGEISQEQYDVWKEKKNYGKVSMGVVRTTYLIDEDGIIIRANDKVKVTDDPEKMLGEV